MRTFRITLSHGSENITFDGAGTRSGSMFHVRRDAIEGLWSSPTSKVSLTERETANGASPISDGETLYAARTVAIPFAIQSNYNHTDLIRARILLGRLIGWHDVRMDINDDSDETVLYGYIEAKYSDIPYDHADAGVITVVCPDPRRISKYESTISMNTSSSGLGGLSFGATAYKFAWTGTPNASTSTLSQDGRVVATNLVTSPKPLAAGWEGNFANMIDTSDGLAVSAHDPNADEFATILNIPCNPDTPYHIVADLARIDGPTYSNGPFFAYESDSQGVLATHMHIGGGGRGVLQEDFTTTPNTRYISPRLYAPLDVKQQTVWRHIGLYTASDWQAMQALGIDWFSGDSQSSTANRCLSFPLNFGQTGNAGNTGMIENNGSYPSMPDITAHGWLDGGLTIHWTTSDGNEGDLSFTDNVGSVPVTIKTDSHSAIMGGLDVSYLIGSRDWPRIPAGGSCSFALLASGNGWVSVQSHDTYM